nr:retrovirus-related Pol polyprotein from transposon TNT 1-94 [Tanacetum cinerariifolium]
KLKNENVELEFQVLNYARENAHLKVTYKNLFDSISMSRVQTETKIASLQNELPSNIYKNAKLRTQLFKKVSDQKDNNQDTSKNTKFAKQPIAEILPKIGETNALSKPVTSNSVSIPQVSKGVNNAKVIAPSMKHKANVSKNETQQKNQREIKKPKKEGFLRRLATPKPRKPRFFLRWSPTGKMFDQDGKLVAPSNFESHVDCSNGDNACCSKHMTGNLKLLINFVWKVLGTVRFGNDHVAAILGFGDLQWGNILITRIYIVEGLGHNLFSVGQFCDSDLEVAFRRNACFVRNLEGVDLLQGDRSTNLYTINLHEMASTSPICLMARASSFLVGQFCDSDLEVAFRRNACFVRNLEGVDLLKRDRLTNLYRINLHEMASASPICLMAHASSTKSWLWHQRLSHLNFNTINDLARNELVACLPKFKYHKEHLCRSCEKGKRKIASHPPKPVPNLRQRLHLLHMDLCGPMRITSIN